ncbi:MAG: D-alanyl-D-alanine carboxypeptidase [Micrococcaceae bacterium]|nr:D-alanyl-D-alanine carboxypeptidase [Micrococcaceae bacterium]
MMAAQQSGRRANRTPKGRNRNTSWLIGLLIGIVGGAGMALVYPAPSTDIMKIQARDWYQSMRDLVTPSAAPGGGTTGMPQVYAAPPIGLPPEADTDEVLDIENVSELVNVNAPRPDTEQLTRALNTEMGELNLNNRMVVVDAATGNTLYDAGGQDQIVPASTLKLFTAATVLEHLDTDHRFATSASYSTDSGVVLTGGGDGLLATGEGTGETMGYAGLADLAEKTWDSISDQFSAGDNLTVDVWADVSRYNQPWVHPGWSESLMTGGWISPIYPMNTFGGFYVNPRTENTAVEDGAVHATAAYARHLTALAEADSMNIEFSYAGQQTRSNDLEAVATVRSAPLGQQLEYAMKQSNNMLFEMFGREAALAAGNSPDFDGTAATMQSTMGDLGISTENLQFVDNSGLSPNSRATLNSMVQLYDVMLADEQFRPVFHALTVAGYDGTMRNRMAEAPYSGIVRSKTGTLEVASSNAGMTVTADGRALWFAVNTTGAGEDYAAARAEQDRLVQVLTDCGCQTE